MNNPMISSLMVYKIREIIYTTLSFLNWPLSLFLPQPRVFILCYHSISSDGWKYGVSLETIKKQISYLVRKYDAISMSDIEAILDGRKKLTRPSFVITFDDGYKEVLLLKDFLNKLHIIPTIFILSDTLHANYKELDTKRIFLEKNEVKILLKEGWTLGSHGATHADFWNMSDKQCEEEVIKAKVTLETIYKTPVRYFAYPKGRYTNRVLEFVQRAHYALAFSMNDGFITTRTNKLLIPRVGVDRSHTFNEFKKIMLPSSIIFRAIIKLSGLGRIAG